ncbi:MAG: flagellar basal body L-ring protein FlgH [Pirellulaceae bacterium]
MHKNRLSWSVLAGAGMLLMASFGEAQDSSLYSLEAQGAPYPPSGRAAVAGARGPRVGLGDASWIHMPTPPPREVQKHDIISVRVDMLSRMASEGELRRRKNSLYDARLNDWIIFDGLRWMKPSPQSDGDPRVRGELRSQYRSLGELETAESLAFNLASEVVDIRPNGNLVLEGRTTTRINDEVWTITLSGLCRPESIGPNNVVLSRDIIDLDIQKVETGSVAAGYQRGWFQKIFDLIQPF